MNSLVILISLVLQRNVISYYLPGVTPDIYDKGEQVKLFVTKLTSTKTQMPYDYYSLPFCKPKTLVYESENFGEVISGDRIENSVYKLEAKTNVQCQIACGIKLKRNEKDAFVNAIEHDYRAHWIVDNLPVGSYAVHPLTRENRFERGFPVGFKIKNEMSEKSKTYLYNHVHIIIEYHEEADGNGIKIVGFRVEPISIKHDWNGKDTITDKTSLSTCNNNVLTPVVKQDPSSLQTINTNDNIVFSYSVKWESSELLWGNRWDIYLTASPANEKVHWFSITNSIMIVLFLTVMIAMILIRALKKDIAKYNDPTNLEEAKEESGWKLVHGDVFRPPSTMPMLFSVFVGTGSQLVCMAIALLTFALFGMLSPDNRGSIVSGFILLFVFMGAFAGYYSSLTYKMFRGTEWKQNTLMTAFLYPGIVSMIILILNLVLMIEGSSGAIPFTTLAGLLFLWFCVSVPLVFLGSYFGYRKEIITFPVRTNQIPRAIPEQVWYLNPVITCLLAGVLPFGAVSVELYFIMSALWLHQIYYIFGFLFLVMIVLFVTCAEVSILLCYFQLCNEDYRWWWRSFLSSGACAGYMLLYAVWYNLTELEITEFVPLLLYFSYMGIISMTFFLITGTVGYFSCFFFNNQIYSYIKVD